MDKNKSREMLEEQIQVELLNVATAKGDEKDAAIERLAKLYKLRIEEIKADIERIEKEEKSKVDREKMVADRWIQIGKIALEFVSFAGMMAFNIHFTNKGFKFEETGTFVSKTFKGLGKGFKLFKAK